MRSILLMGAGLTLTALLLVLPAVHVSRWSGQPLSTGLLVLASLPLVGLVAAVARPSRGLLLWAFPVLHLPALLAWPELTGPLVYGGTWGWISLAAIAAIGATWFVLALRAVRPEAPPPPAVLADTPARLEGAELLPRLVLLYALAIFAAFASTALVSTSNKDVEPLAANVSLLVAIAIVWFVAGRLLVDSLGGVLFEESARRRAMATLFVERTRVPSDMWLTVTLLVIAFGAIALWYAM